MSDSDSNSESDDYYLDDNDPEFIEFKENAKIWIELDDDIKTLNEALKERKQKKKELTPDLLEYMNKYKINDLNTSDGHLKFQKTTRSQSLSKKFLIEKLSNFFKNNHKSEKVVNFLYDSRDKKEIFNLKRVYKKK